MTEIQSFPTNHLWSNYQKVDPSGSEVNEDLLQIQNYCENFIFPLDHHKQSTEAGVQDIVTCSVIGRSEEDDSTLVFLRSIEITPISCDIFKQVELKKRKGNMHMKSEVDDNRQPLYHQSKRQTISGDENVCQEFTGQVIRGSS